MLRRLFGLAALCLLLLPGVAAQAQTLTLKIGYANPDLVQAMPEYPQVYQKLQAESAGDQEAYQALVQEFQEKLDRYQKQQALLSEERRAERENELRTLQQDIQEAERSANQKLARREQELLEPLLDKMQEAIDAVAKEKGLDIVLSQPAVLYVNADRIVNITPDVASRLGISLTGQASN